MNRHGKGSLDWNVAKEQLNSAKAAIENALVSSDVEIAAIYRARAERLMKRGVGVASMSHVYSILVFYLGTERHGIELAHVAEVLPLTHITPVPGSLAEVKGIINVRGEIRAILDIKALLRISSNGGNSEGPQTSGFVLLLRNHQNSAKIELGIQVDQVDQIESISGEMSELPSCYLKGLLAKSIPILDAAAILSKDFKKPEGVLIT